MLRRAKTVILSGDQLLEEDVVRVTVKSVGDLALGMAQSRERDLQQLLRKHEDTALQLICGRYDLGDQAKDSGLRRAEWSPQQAQAFGGSYTDKARQAHGAKASD